jgi:predicted ATPase
MFSEFISKNSKGYIIAETHSDYLVDRIRIDVREGRLNCHNVNIIYFHAGENSIEIHEISIDKQGNLTNCPDRYRDFFIREQERVLGF